MKARHNRHFIKRRSVALISAAIFCASAAHAELEVGRLPSTMVTGGQVVGVKPNVFIIIDNSKNMVKQSFGTGDIQSGDVNFLRVVAKGLRESTKPLVGKVRLGFTTTKNVIETNHKTATCKALKLDGHPGQPASKYGDRGSGWGQLVPHRFDQEYYDFFSGWLGSMCPLLVGYETKASIYPGYDNYPYTHPARYSNYYHSGDSDAITHSPFLDMLANVLTIISDRKTALDVFVPGKPLGETLIVRLERDGVTNTLRIIEDHKKIPGKGYRQYDAYAPIDPKDGYPMAKNPLSCRQNYAVVISAVESTNDRWFKGDAITGEERTAKAVTLPDGKKYDPHDSKYGYMYRTGLNRNADPTDGRRFTGAAFDAYITDLRSDLKNDVSPYMPNKTPRAGINGDIPLYWDRKNDPATWQHLTTFVIGYTRGMPAWKMARDAYNNRSDADYDEGGELEGYFRAIESGDIFALNAPEYFWEKKPLSYKSPTEGELFIEQYNKRIGFLQYVKRYRSCYKKGARNCDDYFLDDDTRREIVKNMGYIFKKEDSTVNCNNTDPINVNTDYVSKSASECSAFVGEQDVKYGENSGYFYTSITPNYIISNSLFAQMDLLRAGMIGRGGSYAVDDEESLKRALNSIVDRIEKAMAQEVSGAGAVSGGGRVTAVQQMGGNSSALFTSYLDEETVSGNLFAYRNCPLIKEKIKNEAGNWVTNPEWIKGQCGQRLWNAATVLENGKNKIEDKTIFPKKKDGKLVGEKFSWSNIKEDSEAKNALQGGESEELAKARVDWINGKEDFSDANIAKKLRKRPNILIPNEGQRYKIGPDGKPVQDNDGNYVLMDEPGTKIPNRVGEIVYATAQAVDPVGTLGAAHKLNKGDYDTFKNKIKNRPPLVLVGANDGRLYGFTSPKDQYAKLAFSYIPRKVIVDGRLTATTKTSYSTVTAKSLVNGPFRVSDAQVDGKWGTYVVGTLGAGGSTAYALEITNKGEAEFKWEIDIDEGRAKIMAPPRIVWLKENKSDKKGQWVVLLPSGYNANDVSLIVLDLKDGKEIARIDTGAKYNANCKLQNSGSNPYMLEETIKLPEGGTALCVDNGLGDLTVTDGDGDDAADYVYAGDLLGHIWKFDLTNLNLKGKNDKLKVAYERPLFIAKDKQGMRQSITTMIEIDDGAYGEGSMLYFGTGRLFNQQERNINQRQSFYAVWENPRYFENLYVQLPLKRDESSPYAFMQYEPVTLEDIESKLSDPDSSLKEYKEIRVIKRVDSLQSDKYLSYDRNGTNINSAAKAMGWVMDFPKESARERVIDRARTFEEAIFFSSFEPKESDMQESCEPLKGSVGGDGRFYMLDRLTGNTLETSAFDYNHDNKRDDQDKIKVDSSLLGGTLTGTGGAESTKLVSPASLMTPGSANFVQLEGVQERGAECDYTRQVIFPGTVDPETGNPMTLLGCYQNRYRVWKQPISNN